MQKSINQKKSKVADLFGCAVARHLHPLLLPVDEQHGDDEDDDDEEQRGQDPGGRLVDAGHLRLAGVVLPQVRGVWRSTQRVRGQGAPVSIFL